MIEKIKILAEKVLVEKIQAEEEITKAGIIIPKHAKRLTQNYRVVKLSDKRESIKYDLKIGDTVMFDKYISKDIEIDGKRYELIDESDIVCIVNETKKGIDKYKIPANYMLVNYTKDNDKYNLKSGHTIYIDTTYKKEYHNPTFGEVLIVPQKLNYFGEEIENKTGDSKFFIKSTTKWKTNIEVEKGDIVHFHYLAVEGAIKLGMFIEDEETKEKYAFIRYDDCFCCEKNDDIKMLNGYIGVTIDNLPEQLTLESGLIFVRKKDKNWGYGRVKYLGSKVDGYLHYQIKDNIDIEVDDIISFSDSKKTTVGKSEHIQNEKIRDIYYMQRKDIQFVIKNKDVNV